MLRVLVLIAAVFLYGCCATTSTVSRPDTSCCDPCDPCAPLRHRVESRGVTVVELGDQILIVMPSWLLFDDMTYKLLSRGDYTLCLVAQYINCYTKMLVKVAGYTSCTGSNRVNLALSQQQAKTVAKTLMKYDVDARVLYAEGYGGTNLVARNKQDWGSNDNYRIEITMEKLP